jgi:hypothetical protein
LKRDDWPGSDRVIVVPGNHDVNRAGMTVAERWTAFLGVSNKFARPWLPDLDPPLGAMKERVFRSCNPTSALWGGATLVQDPKTGDVSHQPVPFIFDHKREVLFYSFNSSSISGTRLTLSARTRDTMEWLRNWRDPNAERVQELIRTVDELVAIDPARIDPQEFSLFNEVVNHLRDQIGEEAFQKSRKIAVLHHHVTPFITEEIKSFDLPTNAGRLKAELERAGFTILLHGHKHYPGTFRDSALPLGGSQIVVSGGTIGGYESGGSFPGFHWLELLGQSLARVRFVPLTPFGNARDVFRDSKVTSWEIRTANEPSESRDATVIPRVDVEELKNATSRQLFKHLRRKTDTAGNALVGWSHHLDEDDVTVVATSFGVRLMRLCSTSDPDFRFIFPDLGRSLKALRHATGWSASGGASVGRPEATCYAALAFWDLCDASGVTEALKMIAGFGEDNALRTSIHSLSLAAYTVATVQSSSPLLDELLIACCVPRSKIQPELFWPGDATPAGTSMRTAIPKYLWCILPGQRLLFSKHTARPMAPKASHQPR